MCKYILAYLQYAGIVRVINIVFTDENDEWKYEWKDEWKYEW